MSNTSLAWQSLDHTYWAKMQISSCRQQLAFSLFGQNVPTALLSITIFLCFLRLLLFHWHSLSGAFIRYFLYTVQSLLEVKRCLQRTLVLVGKLNLAASSTGVTPGLCRQRLPHQDCRRTRVCPSRGGAWRGAACWGWPAPLQGLWKLPCSAGARRGQGMPLQGSAVWSWGPVHAASLW